MIVIGELMMTLMPIVSRVSVAPRWMFISVIVIFGGIELAANTGLGSETKTINNETATAKMRRFCFKSDHLIQEGGQVAKAC